MCRGDGEVVWGSRHGWQCRLQGLCAAEWLQDEEERCLTGHQGEGASSEGRRLELRRGLRVEVRCLLGAVAGSKVTCEGTGLKEVWSELEGGSGAAGRRHGSAGKWDLCGAAQDR